MDKLISEAISREYRQNWEQVLNGLFKDSIPSFYEWDNVDDIIKVLKTISDDKHRVTMFIPGGGDISFRRANYAQEPGCIELDPEAGFILKPLRLTFTKIGENVEWYYFLLETKDLKKSGINDCTGPYYEMLAEIEPGKYSEYNASESEYMINEQLIKPLRNVSRYFKGTFVFFINTSDYNSDASTLDMQNKLSAEDFRVYVETLHNFCKMNAQD